MASKVLSVLMGVLVLTGCASSPMMKTGQPLKTEKLVLNWKDFYPADFSYECNRRVNYRDNNVSFMDFRCYSASSTSDQYQLLTMTMDEEAIRYERHFSDKLPAVDSIHGSFLNRVCKKSMKQVYDVGFECIDNDGNYWLMTHLPVSTKNKNTLAYVFIRHDPQEDMSSEYKTSLAILADLQRL